MEHHLLKEEVIRDLWAGKPISTSNPTVRLILDELYSHQFISSPETTPRLTDEGVKFVVNGRDSSELVGLLDDINLSQEERVFLANAIQGIMDKPFAYEIIKKSAENPERKKYPSVDLGSFDDVEHGVLFNATKHIMIDPQISRETIDGVVQRLQKYGADIDRVDNRNYTTKVRYKVGNTQRTLYFVKADATKVKPAMEVMVKNGIFSLIMKGMGGFRGSDNYGNLLDALERYVGLLRKWGLLLTGVQPQTKLDKIGEGIIAYWVHSSNDYRLSTHGLYQK